MILALYGAGAMGREFKYIADESGEWSKIVFIDDHSTAGKMLNCEICGFHTFRKRYSPQEVRFAITIGEPKFRKEAFERMTEAGYHGARVVHPSATISPDAEVGEGAVIAHSAFIGSLAKVGKNFYAAKGAPSVTTWSSGIIRESASAPLSAAIPSSVRTPSSEAARC